MSQAAPIPLTSIQVVGNHEVDALRRTRLLATQLLFEVFLTVAKDPIILDARQFPYRVIDGRIRIHEARRRGLSHVPAVLTVPRMTEIDLRIEMLSMPVEEDDAEAAAEETEIPGENPEAEAELPESLESGSRTADSPDSRTTGDSAT